MPTDNFPSPNSYDEVPYPSAAYRGTHPDTLATLGTLVGLQPAPVGKCRLLEIGCSDGGNLIPMAYGLPESEFVGMDGSAAEVQSGRDSVEMLGLKNLTLNAGDILEVADQFGMFDYIVTHGVYSWVSPAVQEKILEICKRLLNPHGLVYVSYNTYPGWHMRATIRDMMMFHIRKEADPAKRITRARELLAFLADKVGTPETAQGLTATDTTAYSAALRYEQGLLAQYTDSYLFHEHLEPINEPVYFYQFVERAGRHGLQYVSESDFVSAQLVNFSPAIGESLRGMSSDLIELQQYMDFVSNRTFRQTVLCHQDATLNRTLEPSALSPFYLAAPMQPAAATPDRHSLHSLKEETFNSPTGKTLTAGAPIVKAVMTHLSELWPQSIAFDALLGAAHERLNPGAPHVYTAEHLAEERQLVGQTLLHCLTQGMAEFHVHPSLFTLQIGEHPKASLVARWQSAKSGPVTNMRHEPVALDGIVRQLLPHLDGERDGAQLFNRLAKMAEEGTVVVQSPDGKAVTGEEQRNALLAETLNRSLQTLARTGLLVS